MPLLSNPLIVCAAPWLLGKGWFFIGTPCRQPQHLRSSVVTPSAIQRQWDCFCVSAGNREPFLLTDPSCLWWIASLWGCRSCGFHIYPKVHLRVSWHFRKWTAVIPRWSNSLPLPFPNSLRYGCWLVTEKGHGPPPEAKEEFLDGCVLKEGRYLMLWGFQGGKTISPSKCGWKAVLPVVTEDSCGRT